MLDLYVDIFKIFFNAFLSTICKSSIPFLTSSTNEAMLSRLITSFKFSSSLLPNLTLRAAIRLLFHHSRKIRDQGHDQLFNLIRQLTPELAFDSPLTTPEICIVDEQDPLVKLTGSGIGLFQSETVHKLVLNLEQSFHTASVDQLRNALEQLEVILADVSLHPAFLTNNGPELVTNILSSKICSEKTLDEAKRKLTLHASNILIQIYARNEQLRIFAADDPTLLISLIRIAQLVRAHNQAHRSVICLLAILAFSECHLQAMPEGLFISFNVQRKIRLPFLAQPHRAMSQYRLDKLPKFIDSGFYAINVRLAWVEAVFDSLSKYVDYTRTKRETNGNIQAPILFTSACKSLSLKKQEQLSLNCVDLPEVCSRLMNNIHAADYGATRIRDCMSGLTFLLATWGSYMSNQLYNYENLFNAFESYLLNRRIQHCDHITDVVNFLHLSFENNPENDYIGKWLLSIFENPKCVLYTILELKDENQALINATIHLMVSFIEYATDQPDVYPKERIFSIGSKLITILNDRLKSHLNHTDLTFRIKPLTQPLFCISRLIRRNHWTTGLPVELKYNLFQNLMDIIYGCAPRESSATLTFLGIGLLKSTLQITMQLYAELLADCLQSGKVQKIDTLNHQLLLRYPANDESLDWLLVFFCSRDPQIRATALSLAALLVKTENGCELLRDRINCMPDGCWACFLLILLDSGEAPLVREQAGRVIINMLSHAKLKPPSDESQRSIGCFLPNGPVIWDGEKKITGLLSIIALLHHMNFFTHINEMMNKYTSDIVSKQPVTLDVTVPYFDVAMFSSASDFIPNQMKAQACASLEETNRLVFEQSIAPVTANLIAVVTKILKNLLAMAPQDTLAGMGNIEAVKSMAALISPKELQDLTPYSNVASDAVRQEKFLALVDQYTQTVRMLSLQLILFNSTVGPEMVKDQTVLNAVFGLMAIKIPDSNHPLITHEQKRVVDELNICLFEFLCSALKQNDPKCLADLYEIFCDHWEQVFANFLKILGESNTEDKLSIYCAGALTEICSIIGANNSNDESLARFFKRVLSKMLDKNENGEKLAKILTKLVMNTLPGAKVISSQLKSLGIFSAALQSLIIASETAANCIGFSGLVEGIISEIKVVHKRHLKLTNIEVKKRNDEITINTVTLTGLFLLRNIFFSDKTGACKIIASEFGFVRLMSKLWSWAHTNEKLRSAILTCLQSFTENYERGCNELADLKNCGTGTYFHERIRKRKNCC